MTKRASEVVPGAPNSIRPGVFLADFNSDGKPDLLLQETSPLDALTIRLNDGAGGLLAPVKFPIGIGFGNVAVADFDGDGRPDALVLETRGIMLYSGDGVGGLRPGRLTNIKTAASVFSLSVGDFNGDGFPDLISGSPGGTRVLLNDGHANFRDVQNPLLGSLPETGAFRFQVADYNADGIADVAFALSYGTTLQIALGDGSGHFQLAQTFVLAPTNNLMEVVSGDWNGDGKMDLATVTPPFAGQRTSAGTLTVFLNSGTKLVLQSTQPVPSLLSTNNLTAADFDGDGNLDLAIGTDQNSTTLYFGDGAGAFTARSGYVLSDSFSAVAADLNGDGRADLVVRQGQGLASYLGGLAPASLLLAQEPANPFTFRQTVTLVATLSSNQAFSAPSGSVQLFDGAALVGSAALTLGLSGGPASARFTLPYVPGVHQYRAVYGGDPRFSTAAATLTSVQAGTPASLTDVSTIFSLRALVSDAMGNPVSGVGMVFTAPAVGPSVTFNGSATAVVFTDASGIAAAPMFMPNATSGVFAITATVSGYPGLSVVFRFAIFPTAQQR